MVSVTVVLISLSSLLGTVVFGNDVIEKSRLMGVEAVHDVKINKDSIITRNLKIDKKRLAKNAQSNEGAPDWSYSAVPQELSKHVQDFKRNMSECLKEVQDKDAMSVKRLSPKPESPVHGECLIACVLARNGVIEKGKINRGNLIALVSKFYAKDTKLMKKLEKNVDRCVEKSARLGGDACAQAAALNSCTNAIMAGNKHGVVLNY